MTDPRERIIVAVAVASPTAAAAALTGKVVLFSTLICLLIGLGFALGYAQHLRRWSVSLTLAGTFLTMALLFASSARLHDSEGPLQVALGFPIQTTLFVWLIWPLGVVMGLLHALTFDKLLLPTEKVEKIRAKFGNRSDLG